MGEAVRERAVLEDQAGIRDSKGRWLSRTNPAELERRYGPTATVHRAKLLSVLHTAVPERSLRNGVTVSRLRPDGTVVHSGESRADLVLGADGIRSVVRTLDLAGRPSPRYAGYTTWRMITPPVAVNGSPESWVQGNVYAVERLRSQR